MIVTEEPIIKKVIVARRNFMRLGDVAEYLNGRAFKPAEWEPGGMPIVRIQNLNDPDAGFNYSTQQFDERFRLRNGELLFAWSASLGAYLWNRGDAWLNQHIFKVIPKQVVNKKYLFYALSNVVNELYTKTHGSGMVHVTKGKFEATEIYCPSLPEQHRIVSKIEELFSELDAAITTLKATQQQLQIHRQSVLKHAFEGYFTGGISKWIETNVDFVAEKIQIGPFGSQLHQHDYINGGIPLVNPMHIQNGRIVADSSYTISVEKRDSLPNYILTEGDIIMGRRGEMGRCALVSSVEAGWFCGTGSLFVRPNKQKANSKYILYLLSSKAIKEFLDSEGAGTTMTNLNLKIVKSIPLLLPPLEQQEFIISEIESRFSESDHLLQTINQQLTTAESLRQSILQKAFSGELLKEQKVFKPKNLYFYQVQILAWLNDQSRKNNIEHGEMTIAKYAYLLDRLYNIPTYYQYQRWHLGPYPPEMKKALNNKRFFGNRNGSISSVNMDELLKYNNPYFEKTASAVKELASIFSMYSGKVRSEKTELLATVCKVIEDINSIDLQAVRDSMAEWKIDLKNTSFKTKAEKFSVEETKKCIEFITSKNWHYRLLK